MKKPVLLLFVCITAANFLLGRNKDIAWMRGGSGQGFSRVVFSANGKYILSSSPYDIKIWSLENGALLKAISYGTSPRVGSSFGLSPDGRYLFFTDTSKVHCLDIDQDSIIYTLKAQEGFLQGVALSSDGNLLIAASGDSTCALWDLRAKERPKQVFMMNEIPLWVSFSCGARSFLVSGYNRSSVLSRETGKKIHTFKSTYFSLSSGSDLLAVSFGHRAGYIGTNQIGIYELPGRHIRTFTFKRDRETVREFCLSSSGRFLVVRADRSIKVFDSSSGTLLKEIQGEFHSSLEEFEGPLSVSPDERFVAVGMDYVDDEIRKQGSAYIKTIGIWDIQSGKQIQMLRASQSGFLPPPFASDSHLIVTAEDSHELKLWEVPTGKLMYNFTESLSSIKGIVSGPGTHASASMTEQGCVSLWDQITGKTLWNITSRDMKASDIRFSSDGQYLITTTLHESEVDREGERPDYVVDTLKIFLWDVKSGTKIMQYDIPKAGWCRAVFSGDGTQLFISDDEKIETWDISRKTAIPNPTIDGYRGYGAFSPRLNYIYRYGEPTGTIQVWDVRGGKQAFKVPAHNGFVRTLSWPQDEKVLVTSGQDDGMIKVWNVPDGKILKTIKMNITEVQNGEVSPNGKYFAGGNRSGTIEIWDLESGNIVRTYSEYKYVVTSIAWSSDGRFVYSGFLDGTLIAWSTQL